MPPLATALLLPSACRDHRLQPHWLVALPLSLPFLALHLFLFVVGFLAMRFWQLPPGALQLCCFASHLLSHTAPAEWEARSFIKAGLDWPGDEGWREKSNSVDPLLAQQMAPGWEEKVSKQAAADAGALCPAVTSLIVAARLIIWGVKGRTCAGLDLHSFGHCACQSADEMLEAASTLNEANGGSAQAHAYNPSKSHADGVHIKVVSQGAEEWLIAQELCDQLHRHASAGSEACRQGGGAQRQREPSNCCWARCYQAHRRLGCQSAEA